MDLSILNKEQKEAVLYNDGPLLVIAGAGSGKTRVLTYKVAYLIEQGVEPSSILCITFTNKATDEMKQRIFDLLKNYDNYRRPYISTFHSFCRMILIKYIECLGYSSNFIVFDDSDQVSLINKIKKEFYGDTITITAKNILSRISYCKSHNISKEEYEKNAYNTEEKIISKIFYEYDKRLKEQNALDYDDMLIFALEIFKVNKDALIEFNNRFKYILVDEYQDTNEIQFDLIRHLTLKYQNITVVGDDDQSIYKFRGADISNILNFENLFSNAKVIKLTHNYRSNQNILNVANEVIKNNKNRKDKKLWSEIEKGSKVSFTEYETDDDEACDIIKKIFENKDYNNTCILYRSSYLSNKIERYCKEIGVPYQLLSGLSFYKREEVKDILSYLRYVVSNKDSVSLDRIINLPKRGIGDVSIDKITEYSNENKIDFYTALLEIDKIQLSDKVKNGVKSFVDLIEKIKNEQDIVNMVQLVVDNGYLEHLKSKFDDKDVLYEKIQNINEIKNDLAIFKNKAIEEGNNDNNIDMLTKYLQNVSLFQAVDSMENEVDKIKLMTIHSAKGLEFDNVYIIGLNEKIFPSSQSINAGKDEEIEEERRLMYVGCTRAKYNLYLSCSKSRYMMGRVGYLTHSRFIDEISNDVLDKISASHVFRRNFGYQNKNFGYQNKNFDKNLNPHYNETTIIRKKIDENEQNNHQSFMSKNSDNIYKKVQDIKKLDGLTYKVGDIVNHIKFGEGIVKKIEDVGRDYQVVVDFYDEGEKTLFATFAKLEKVN